MLCPGVSNLFCSLPCVPTAFKGTSPNYLNHWKVCPLRLFDLYLQTCLFCYRSGLYFDKCSLTDLLSMMAQGFTLARDRPKRRMVRGLLSSCHGCSPKPIISCLASLSAKAPPEPLTRCRSSSGSPPPSCYVPPQSIPIPLGHHPKAVHVPLCRSAVPTQPVHGPKQSSPNNHKSSTTQQHPIPVHCNCSSTLTALHCAPQLIHNSTTPKFFRAICPLYFSMH